MRLMKRRCGCMTPTFPLLNKEMERAEFDRMLAENPLNDPLAYIVEDVPVPAGTERSKEPAPPLAREPVSERSRDDYNSIKKQNPDSLVLYQADDFFEMYSEDAWRVGPMLGLETTVRTIPDISLPKKKYREKSRQRTGGGRVIRTDRRPVRADPRPPQGGDAVRLDL